METHTEVAMTAVGFPAQVLRELREERGSNHGKTVMWSTTALVSDSIPFTLTDMIKETAAFIFVAVVRIACHQM